MALLPEGKSQGQCLVQLCTKYKLVSATSSPSISAERKKEAASLKVKGPLYSSLLITCLPSGSRTLN